METIGFLDPDAPKKRRYLRHLQAIKNKKRKEGISEIEQKLMGKFFERRKLNSHITDSSIQNLVGWARTLFRLQSFDRVVSDLAEIGLDLDISDRDKVRIKREFNRRNRKAFVPVTTKTRGPVEVQYKKRRR